MFFPHPVSVYLVDLIIYYDNDRLEERIPTGSNNCSINPISIYCLKVTKVYFKRVGGLYGIE